ncbi:hypothetical protein EJ03DRAFT_354969 [Teratosphaeria nubilosa]|uniref:CID domain-containing protein n=1 Tax=Teratosphaeria nubilosa TaxID=161662 RepID=A0A6G1KXE1_9PEZI|nr:hypothetical protein EJ03DRAFT_354969 [Teratosphaeria nubilosa]
MASRSPRGSLSGASDIAADFEEYLKDLSKNDRGEIMNLTTIAKESSEHAQAISRVLERHIQSAPPTRKLPALYVLDSIVKNVAEPYSNYLERNLYKTFFEAYTQVDPNTRRAMENLVKTWKEPVPGSMSSRPVFPAEAVRPIENALIKFKTATLQHQKPPQPAGYRNTPTPPQYNGQFAMPTNPVQQSPYPGYGSHQPTPPQHYQLPAFQQPSAPLQHQYNAPHAPIHPPPVNLQTLTGDITSLVERMKAQFASNPYDQGMQTKLSALFQLQKMVNAGDIPPNALQSVRDQVSNLAASMNLPPPTPQPQYQAPTPVPAPAWQAQPPPSMPAWQAPQIPQPYQTTQVPPFVPPASAPAQPNPHILPPGALNSLQSLLASAQKPSTPQMRAAAPVLQNASHAQLSNVQNNVAAAPPANPADLLAALAKSGVLSNLPKVPTPAVSTPIPPPAPAAVPPPQPASAADLLKSLSGLIPAASQNGTTTNFHGTSKPRIPISAANLKVFRPELVRSLYDDQPNQCNNCGRRFLATDEGRQKKARHLDWHFRTNTRMQDSTITRGQHRKWFVDENTWVKTKEWDWSTTTAEDTAAVEKARKERERGPQDQFVRAPPGMTANTCSICQEEMGSKFSDDLQDWVFMNAVVHGGKICHATCVKEILGNGGFRGLRSATPESALGKRKAESVLGGVGSKVRIG